MKTPCKVEQKAEPSLFLQSCLFILDATHLLNCAPVLLEAIKENSSKIIVVLPSDSPSVLKNHAERVSPNIISFPVLTELFLVFVNRMLADLSVRNETFSSSCDDYPSSESVLGFFGGNSEAMRMVRMKIEKAARLDTPVLLLGETGTGKSTAANLIHKMSARSRKPFMSMNVSTISDTLACSTLFGTESGAYTDAVKKEGMFKTADGGSLFLDEIGMASLPLQAMLLTAIETGMIQKVGSEKSEKVDVRVMFATNASMDLMLKDGSFRPDLYFRISDILIQIPSLRERKEDLRFMAEDFARKQGRVLSEDFLRTVEAYHWPGNIRELHQCLGRAFRNCGKEIVTAQYLDFGLFN